jgi:aldehyde dehydrogenase (NAD+)
MTAVADIAPQVNVVREGFQAGVLRTIESRRTQLVQLRRLLTEQEDVLVAALHADLGKPPTEAYLTELSFVINDIDHVLRHLDEWLADEKVRVPVTFRPASARLVRQPYGTVLIIGTWNYPVQLLVGPLVGALAAGNSVVLKPSEVAAATSSALAELIPRYLDERVVTVVTGGVPETTALLQQRFDHIFFTGNGRVGRVVMTAAAAHLTPVTLELGGKTPAVVLADSDIDVAARRIAWGKFLNAGQTCIAPDYVLVETAAENALLGALLRAVHDFFGEAPRTSADYGRIVNQQHHDRLTALLDAGGFEATIVGGHGDRSSLYLPPTVLAGVKPDAAVMQEEIFGPILPVLPIDDVDAAITFINEREKPLALYVFSCDERSIEKVVDQTSSGGVCVNETMIQCAVPELPFGGVGASGIGSYHGRWGFDTFTHVKPVMEKPPKPDPSVLYPPYKIWKQKILRKLL